MVAIVLCVAGCADAQVPTTPYGPTATAAAETTSNAAQVECRTSNPLALREAFAALGPACAAPPTNVGLAALDLGSYMGFVEASRIADVQIDLCACSDGKCSEQNAEAAIEHARKVMITSAGRAERDGALSVMNGALRSPCIDANISVSIFRLGFDCGFVASDTTGLIEQQWMKAMLIIEGGDADRARSRMDECRHRAGSASL